MVRSPFVRVGAVVTCVSCKHRYLADQSHIKRVPSAAKAGPGASLPVGVSGLPAETNPPAPGGIHGLSEMMRTEAERERNSQFDDYDTITPEPEKPGTPVEASSPPSVSKPESKPRPHPQRSREQKAIRSGYLLAAGAALAMAVLGVGLWYIDWDLGAGPTPPVESIPEPEPVYNGPIFQSLPLLQSVLLEHRPWEQPNRPFESTPPQDSDIYIADDSLIPAGAGVIEYIGRVVSEKPGIIMSGELVISLVSPQGEEKALTTSPITLVSPDHSQLLHIPIPANLDPTSLHPAWSISIDELQESAVFLEDVSVKIESMGADTMALVMIGNDTDQTLERVTLVITAWGEDDHPRRRWRVHWVLPIKTGDHIEFFTRTAINPSWDIREWTVIAAAE